MGRGKNRSNSGRGINNIADRHFWESADLNNLTFLQYYNRLTEIGISVFKWNNLPNTIDERFMELTLFSEGMAIFFNDEVLGELCLQTMIGGNLDVYRNPVIRTAYASNGYQKKLSPDDSVIIYNNRLHTNSRLDVEMFARRLAELDRVIDVNVRAQKTPVLVQCDENQRLTMENLYKEFEGNSPVIYAQNNLDLGGLKVLKTDAPFVAQELFQLKTEIWNEALTYLGVSNVSINKKERLIKDEVQRNLGGVMASRYSRLEARNYAAEQINRMFGLDIYVEYREELEQDEEIDSREVGDNNE